MEIKPQLVDISKGIKNISDTLKDISSKLGDQPEADAYVRDQILIKWAYDHRYWFDGGSTIEDIYKHWMEDIGGKL